MNLTLGQVFQYAIGLSPEEATFSRRGFHLGDPSVRDRLEDIGRTFISGYNEALATSELAALERRLDTTEEELRGFAFEGAATALTLLDHLTPWNRGRLQRFIAGPAARHVYMAHIGAGWAIARLPWLRRRVHEYLTQFDPLLCWLAVDGYGFEEGFFRPRNNIGRQIHPTGLSEYARRVFDQGLGRSLWFVESADVNRIPETIASFPVDRWSDLWSGVGLACAYAGVIRKSALESMGRAAGCYRPQVAQGAAFAAKARQLAGNPSAHTELACQIFCGLTADESATVTDVAMVDLPPESERLPAYEIWRQRIQSHFSWRVIAA